ncbi:hypothetical protein CEUSTIGMA_g12431.t1 [Chlamydomonas eustigma]|uniref:Uncharacterized protein n=1 Tax=Chlamydomonas eustigma TaxID=1157962 RepID=A0A250XQD2_9CHLO|nr:hypothetical protein CEUSTIGMA_g12431.t1 [Chlamydomonas eustigma]|eukprot:GAX85010.1 hypothetical protein CEUSTIGMA_g12431.t1 [Chlamydomonas eustigma]
MPMGISHFWSQPVSSSSNISVLVSWQGSKDTPETRMEMPVPTRPLARVLQRVLQATESEARLRPTAKDLMALHLFSNQRQLGTERGMLDFVLSQCNHWKDISDAEEQEYFKLYQQDLWQGDIWLNLMDDRVLKAIGETLNVASVASVDLVASARNYYKGRTVRSVFRFVRNVLTHSADPKAHRVSSMAYECMTNKIWTGSMDKNIKEGTVLRYVLWRWPTNLLVVLMLLAANKSEKLISSPTGCSMLMVMQANMQTMQQANMKAMQQANMQNERALSGNKTLYDGILEALAQGTNTLSELGSWLAIEGIWKPGTGGLKKFIDDKMKSTVKAAEGNISIRRL